MATKKRKKPRSDGRVLVQVYAGKVDGVKKYINCYGNTQKEAEALADIHRSKRKKGINISRNKETFSYWSKRFLNSKEPPAVGAGQFGSLQSYCNHLDGYLADIPIVDVYTSDLQEIINDLAKHNPNTGKPASKKFLEGLKSAMDNIMQLAWYDRVLDFNPVGGVKIPKNAPREYRRALYEEEQQWIHNTPHRAQKAAMIMMYAGLRRGELIALEPDDIDLENASIEVHQSVEMVGGKPHVKEFTKTEAGMRTVYIPQILVQYLREHPSDGSYVCLSAKGKIMGSCAWKRMWDSYLHTLNMKYGGFGEDVKKYAPTKIPFKIPRITAHWLRHTFASILYMAGVGYVDAKELMGHENVQTTIDVYTHIDKQFKKKSMKKVDGYLKERINEKWKHST